jgi:ATP/maltotriose-dependent transcriptional regulator MalT/DNA-binding SARP family transcriptional activator
MSKRASPAKISRPRLFDVVPRERLFELLDGNRDRPLMWIASPPGSGKTTLVASYLETRGIPTIWYQIDASDADPAMLFHYLSQAAQVLREADSPALPRFVPEHLADLPAFARLYFRALYERLPGGAVVVLDNYQEAPEGAPLHEIVEQCVAETAPEHSVVCISRQEAPGPFVRFAASGAMVFIGWDHLRLNLDEVKEVSARRGVTDGRLTQALHQQSQGWAAGVTLMLERLGHLDGPPGELPSDCRESVFNYFASLVFDRAPESTRHVLLSVAFLPQVTPALARELSGRPDAALVLEDLYRRRMFTDRRSGPEPVYQFHALFRDFLKARASEAFQSQQLGELLVRTAGALEAAGSLDAAVELCVAAKEWAQAVRLVLAEARTLLNRGQRQTLRQWIERFPGELLAGHPRLLYWLGRTQLQISPSEGVRVLERALELFRHSDDREGHVECLIELLSGSFLGFHALDALDRWLDELLAELERVPTFTSEEVELRVWAVLSMTLFHVRPWHPLTVPAYHRVEELLPRCADPSVRLTAAMHALVVSGLCGDFARGDRIAAESEPLAARQTASPAEAAWWFAQVGWLRLVEARYEEALDCLDKGSRIAESNGLRSVMRQIILWRFTVQWRIGEWSAASAALAEVEAMPRSSQPMLEATLLLFKARRAHYRGQPEEAASLAMESQKAAMLTKSRIEEVVFCLSNADVLLEARRTADADALVTHARKLIERASVYRCFWTLAVFMRARCDQLDSNHAAVLENLKEALACARKDNGRYYLRFADYAMRPLFKLALEERVEVDLVRDVIRMFRLKPPQDAPESWPWPVRIVTLGRFEVQVNGQPVEFSRKLPRKTLLLLKSIVAHGGRNVPEQTLCDSLWGDEDGDAAANALAITVVRLRRLLGTTEAIIQQGGRISLNPELCWVDVWHFERLVTGNAPLGALLSVYGGALLPEEEGEPWSVAARERLRGKFIDALSRHGATLEQQGDLQGAVQCYLRGIDADPIVEAFHQGLMRCYERMGRRTEALSAYRRLKQTLSVVLGVPPSEPTQQLFQDMLQRQVADGSLGGGEPATTIEESGAAVNRSGAGNVVRRLPVRRKQAR